MPTFSSSARQVVLLIGNSRTKYKLWGDTTLPELSRLFKAYSTKGNLSATLEWLQSYDLVSEATSRNGKRTIALTHKGFRVYCAMKYEGGITMNYDHIGVRTSLSFGLENELSFIENFFVAWSGNFVHGLRDALYDYKLTRDCIFFCYTAMQSSPFDWLSHILYYGAYDVVLRELRGILEGLFVAYNLDTQNHGKSLDEKLNAMTDLEKSGKGHGIAVFRSSDIPDWKNHYAVYTELCGYVHSTRQIAGHKISKVAQLDYPELVEIEFSQDNFVQCVAIWRKIGTAAVVLANELLKFYKIDDYIFGFNVFDEA